MADELSDRAELVRTWAIDEWASMTRHLVAQDFDAVPAGLSTRAKREQWIGLTEAHYLPTQSVHLAGIGAGKGAVGGVHAASEYTIQSDYFEEAGVVVDEKRRKRTPTNEAEI